MNDTQTTDYIHSDSREKETARRRIWRRALLWWIRMFFSDFGFHFLLFLFMSCDGCFDRFAQTCTPNLTLSHRLVMNGRTVVRDRRNRWLLHLIRMQRNVFSIFFLSRRCFFFRFFFLNPVRYQVPVFGFYFTRGTCFWPVPTVISNGIQPFSYS